MERTSSLGLGWKEKMPMTEAYFTSCRIQNTIFVELLEICMKRASALWNVWKSQLSPSSRVLLAGGVSLQVGKMIMEIAWLFSSVKCFSSGRILFQSENNCKLFFPENVWKVRLCCSWLQSSASLISMNYGFKDEYTERTCKLWSLVADSRFWTGREFQISGPL